MLPKLKPFSESESNKLIDFGVNTYKVEGENEKFVESYVNISNDSDYVVQIPDPIAIDLLKDENLSKFIETNSIENVHLSHHDNSLSAFRVNGSKLDDFLTLITKISI